MTLNETKTLDGDYVRDRQIENQRAFKPGDDKEVYRLDNIYFRYGETHVLRGLDLQVKTGDYMGIVGENGSGKTTLLRILVGDLKPTEGEMRLFDVPNGKKADCIKETGLSKKTVYKWWQLWQFGTFNGKKKI